MSEAQPELDNMPATSPKVYLSGTPTAPEGTFTGLSKDDIGSEFTLVVTARLKKEGVQAQDEGTRPFLNLAVQSISEVR